MCMGLGCLAGTFWVNFTQQPWEAHSTNPHWQMRELR